MRIVIIAIVLSLLNYTGHSQNHETSLKKLTESLEQIYSRGHINGFSVAVVNQKDILYTKGFGYADVSQNKKYTEHSIQNIASISKTFIGVALLKAQELGKLTLDDPINQYVPFTIHNPYFPEEPITIRHLASHTSTIKDPARYEKSGYVLQYENNPDAKVNKNFRPPSEMIELESFLEKVLSKEGDWYKKKTFLKNKPGGKFEYSNVGAGLAAFILQKATGTSFSQFTKTHILEPLQISNSGWFFDEVDMNKHSKLYANKETELALYRLVTYADGGFITSSTGLGKYLSELIAGYNGNGTILSQESYKELYAPQLNDQNHKDRRDNKYNDEYNMGVFMGISAQGQIGHTGGDPGVSTFMFFDTKSNIGKLLIINTDLNQEGVKEFLDIWKTLEEFENKL